MKPKILAMICFLPLQFVPSCRWEQTLTPREEEIMGTVWKCSVQQPVELMVGNVPFRHRSKDCSYWRICCWQRLLEVSGSANIGALEQLPSKMLELHACLKVWEWSCPMICSTSQESPVCAYCSLYPMLTNSVRARILCRADRTKGNNPIYWHITWASNLDLH